MILVSNRYTVSVINYNLVPAGIRACEPKLRSTSGAQVPDVRQDFSNFLNKETSIEIRYSKFQNVFLRLFYRFEEKRFLKLQYSVYYFNPSYDLFSHHTLTHTSADFLFFRQTNFYFFSAPTLLFMRTSALSLGIIDMS